MQREKRDNGAKTKPVQDVLDNDSCITPAIDLSVVCTCSHHLTLQFAKAKSSAIYFPFFSLCSCGKVNFLGRFCGGGGVIQ